ncbi:unnamed protein product, partial [Ectocarpus sp. 12 AP-2014]
DSRQREKGRKTQPGLEDMDDHSLSHACPVKREIAGSGNPGNREAEYAAAAAAALAKGPKSRGNVAGFLVKAYQIFDTPAWSDVCGWGEGGNTVVIRKQVEFAKHILPLFFNHSNLQSFVRQLNMYNFRKVMQDPSSGEFKHDLFRKGNEHLLHKIKRKQSAAAAATNATACGTSTLPTNSKFNVDGAGSGTALVAGGIVHEADKVLDELVELRKWKEDMESTLDELKQDKQTLQSENQMLKGHVAEHGQQQKALQKKMQKILFCMYDGYVSGLRGITAPGDAEAVESNKMTAPATTATDSAQGQRLATILPPPSLAGSEGAAASTALEKALKELAALAGENLSSRINALDMENPWTVVGEGSGSACAAADAASGGGAGVAAADGQTIPVKIEKSMLGKPSASAGGSGSKIVGGGSLKRNRTWSLKSYEWLRSLRDPHPLGSLENQSGISSGVSKDNGKRTTEGGDAGEDAAAWRSYESMNVSSTSNGPGGNDASVCTTPDLERQELQQRASPSCSSSSPKPERGGSAPVVTHSEGAANAVTATGNENMYSASSSDQNDSSACALSGDGGSHHGSLHTSCSFHPNSPLPDGDSLSSIINAAGTTRQSVAAAGGSAGNGDVWGGGALIKNMSEGATQMVSELDELGHRQGEALSKIDSLGLQLTNLLDPSLLDDMIMLDSTDDGGAFDIDDTTAAVGNEKATPTASSSAPLPLPSAMAKTWHTPPSTPANTCMTT